MMIEQTCRQCQHPNALENNYCGRCGASLRTSELLAPKRAHSLIPISESHLPQLKQIGKTVAISLVALAAEAGLAWLRRRLETGAVQPAPQAGQAPQQLPVQVTEPKGSRSIVTIFRQRVLEMRDGHGRVQRIVERDVWQREA